MTDNIFSDPTNTFIFIMLALFALTLGAVIVINVGGCLLNILLVFGGLWKTETFGGTISGLKKIQDQSPRHLARKVEFTLTDGKRLTVDKLLIGPDLRGAGVVQAGAHGGWLVAGRRKGSQRRKEKLLGHYNGEGFFVSQDDLAQLNGLAPVNALLAGLVCFALALTALLLDPVQPYLPTLARNNFWPTLGLSLILPFFILALGGQAAAWKMAKLAEKRLRNFAAASNFKRAEGRPAPVPSAAPLVETAEDGKNAGLFLLGLATGSAGLSLLIYPLAWITEALTSLTVAWAAPKFEMKRLKIISHLKVQKDYLGRYAYKRAVLKDSSHGREISVKWLLVADNLAESGLIAPGREGQWLLTARGPGQEGQIASLKAAAFFDGSGLHYRESSVLKLFRYSHFTPLWAALAGLAAWALCTHAYCGSLILNLQTGSLMPIFILLPVLMMLKARRRIINAAREALRPSLAGHLNIPSGR